MPKKRDASTYYILTYAPFFWCLKSSTRKKKKKLIDIHEKLFIDNNMSDKQGNVQLKMRERVNRNRFWTRLRETFFLTLIQVMRKVFIKMLWVSYHDLLFISFQCAKKNLYEKLNPNTHKMHMREKKVSKKMHN